jgi:hypothetical protein
MWVCPAGVHRYCLQPVLGLKLIVACYSLKLSFIQKTCLSTRSGAAWHGCSRCKWLQPWTHYLRMHATHGCAEPSSSVPRNICFVSLCFSLVEAVLRVSVVCHAGMHYSHSDRGPMHVAPYTGNPSSDSIDEVQGCVSLLHVVALHIG